MNPSNDHDPLCRFGEHSVNCECHLIAKVRADEREKIDNALYYRIEDCEQMVADARANERVLIAQAIEAVRVTYDDDFGWMARKAYADAARIARGSND